MKGSIEEYLGCVNFYIEVDELQDRLGILEFPKKKIKFLRESSETRLFRLEQESNCEVNLCFSSYCS